LENKLVKEHWDNYFNDFEIFENPYNLFGLLKADKS